MSSKMPQIFSLGVCRLTITMEFGFMAAVLPSFYPIPPIPASAAPLRKAFLKVNAPLLRTPDSTTKVHPANQRLTATEMRTNPDPALAYLYPCDRRLPLASAALAPWDETSESCWMGNRIR